MTPYEIISKKRDSKILSGEEIRFFILGYTEGRIPDYQMSALLMAIYLNGMTVEETHELTQTMLHSGEVVDLSEIPGAKVDKHSTGGVGDKVSLILAPIVAAAGIPVPMISGRGLGHSGGTLDKLESIPGFRVNYNIDEYRQIIKEVGTCLIGQTSNLAPADKKIYALRDVTATVQNIPLITASIMSKKLAEGIDALVLDVKCGHGAFMTTLEDARALAHSLISTGKKAGKKVTAFITDMNNPLGNTVGNWLEVRECIDCLHGKGPDDLMEVTHNLCGAMLLMGGKADTLDAGKELSRQMISSGKAWKKFLEIVQHQQGDISVLEYPERYPEPKFTSEVLAEQDGWVASIDALEVGLTAIQLGAGRQQSSDEIDPKAGIVLVKKPGQPVKKGDTILRLFTDRGAETESAATRLREAIQLSRSEVHPPQMIIETIL